MMAGLIVALCLTGCRESGSDPTARVPRNPAEAASQLEQVFAAAPGNARQNATSAAEALRQGDYEKAVAALQVLRSGSGVTLEQGLAIHHSVVAMETRLMNAMNSGDPNAKRAYELLRALKRN